MLFRILLVRGTLARCSRVGINLMGNLLLLKWLMWKCWRLKLIVNYLNQKLRSWHQLMLFLMLSSSMKSTVLRTTFISSLSFVVLIWIRKLIKLDSLKNKFTDIWTTFSEDTPTFTSKRSFIGIWNLPIFCLVQMTLLK